jgi:hypothetical protein
MSEDTITDLDLVGVFDVLHCNNQECVNSEDGIRKDDIAEFDVLAAFTHDEGPAIECDACSESVESAYGDPEEEKLYEQVREVLRADQDATTALLAGLPIDVPLGYPSDQEETVFVYKTQPSPYSAPDRFAYHVTDEGLKHIIGTIGVMVPEFWDRATNCANEDWENDITFETVSTALKTMAGKVAQERSRAVQSVWNYLHNQYQDAKTPSRQDAIVSALHIMMGIHGIMEWTSKPTNK